MDVWGKKTGCVTSGEQAVSTVGGSRENGIIHVLLAHSVYLSLFASLPHFLSLRHVEPALCS